MTRLRFYQINFDRDVNEVAYVAYGYLLLLQGSEDVDASIYDLVYDGEMDISNLDAIYRIFNTQKPGNYCGRSPSVSDVIEIVSSDSIAPDFYFCNTISFKPISFKAELAHNKIVDEITVVMCEPGKIAKVENIGASLKDMQKAVKGYIEVYRPFDDSACIICNEDAKITGMPPCRAIYDEGGKLIDIIHGTFFICASDGENFVSLSSEQQEKYKSLFYNPELLLGQVFFN